MVPPIPALQNPVRGNTSSIMVSARGWDGPGASRVPLASGHAGIPQRRRPGPHRNLRLLPEDQDHRGRSPGFACRRRRQLVPADAIPAPPGPPKEGPGPPPPGGGGGGLALRYSGPAIGSPTGTPPFTSAASAGATAAASARPPAPCRPRTAAPGGRSCAGAGTPPAPTPSAARPGR
jgi:hypothetical protein